MVGLLQGYPAEPATERATSRGSLFHLSLPGRVPERVSEKPGYMQIRTPSPSLVLQPLLPIFLRIVTHEDLGNGAPRYVLRREKEPFPLPRTYVYARADVRTQRTRSPLRTMSSGFHPSRIDITRSATSTLKPLSTFSLSRPARRNLGIGDSLRQWREGNVAPIYHSLLYRAIYARESFS